MEKQPASSKESTLAKREKNGRKKIQRICKKYIFHLLGEQVFLEIIQTSRNLPMQYEERDLGISQ